jgi:indole-3-glycerol phosphate synthase
LESSKKSLEDEIKNSNQATLITEIKFSSPALGSIRKISNPVDIAKQMINGGASALSVLTQPFLFDGSPELFMNVRKQVDVPMVMKDITINKVQIDAAKKIGADYFLLIQSIFDKNMASDINGMIDYGHELGLKVLVEAHTKQEFENSCKTNADLIGINNRNLDTLKIDLNTTKEILENSEKEKLIISESGISNPDDIRFLHKYGADAYLVGSNIMKADNIQQAVQNLVNAI